MILPRDIRDAVTAAIARTDTAWALNRPKAMDRTRAAVMAAIEPLIVRALEKAQRDGYRMATVDGEHDIDVAKAAARASALNEAATMLKRHGHRTAVTRVQALADTPQTPARPQPAQSPADEPGNPPTAPDTQEGAAGAPRALHGPQNGTSVEPGSPARDIHDALLGGNAPQRVYVHTAQEWEDGGGRG